MELSQTRGRTATLVAVSTTPLPFWFLGIFIAGRGISEELTVDDLLVGFACLSMAIILSIMVAFAWRLRRAARADWTSATQHLREAVAALVAVMLIVAVPRLGDNTMVVEFANSTFLFFALGAWIILIGPCWTAYVQTRAKLAPYPASRRIRIIAYAVTFVCLLGANDTLLVQPVAFEMPPLATYLGLLQLFVALVAAWTYFTFRELAIEEWIRATEVARQISALGVLSMIMLWGQFPGHPHIVTAELSAFLLSPFLVGVVPATLFLLFGPGWTEYRRAKSLANSRPTAYKGS